MSDYIPRLREELVAAAARERAGGRRPVPRVRWGRVGLVAAAALVAAALVLAIRAVDLPRDEQPALPSPETPALDYRVTPVPGGDASDAAQRSAEILRARLAAAGVQDATVTASGARIAIEAPPAVHDTVAALAAPGRLAIYDWEASVLGPDGRPAPDDERVTGGPDAGRSGSVSRYEAVLRAAKAPGGAGPTAYWLLDDSLREVLAGPQWSREALGPSPDGTRVVGVAGGVRVVHVSGTSEQRWFALAGSPAVRDDDVANARATRGPTTGEPVVDFELTRRGQIAFESLTREIAQRGAAADRPGADPRLAAQHLAIVVDDELTTVPYIDFRQTPDGIDGSSGVTIEGGLTPERARQIAIMLETGALPATLTPAEAESP